MGEHVRAGGSRIHRIIACPRSLQAPEGGESEEAAKGTTAHHVGERCLMTGCDPDHPSFLGLKVLGQEVTRAMADAVAVYVGWVRDIIERCKAEGVEHHLFLESPVDWQALDPPEPMRGSSDCIIVVPAWQLMVVGDYKNGTVPVAHVGNKQVRYYAVGALMTLPREVVSSVRYVDLAIIQPNAIPMPEGGAVRVERIEVGELIDFAEEAIAAVRAGQAPDAPAAAGDHCKYCGFSGNCPTRAEWAVTQAQNEFEVVAAPAQAIAVMPVEELGAKALVAEKLIDRMAAWLKDAKARIEGELKAGTDVPGWKMVPKRATRVWNDVEAVKQWALLDMGLDSAAIHTKPELLSPAQIEEVVGKKKLPASLYSKVSSGYNLANADAAKPAARISAGDEFNAEP